MNNTLIWVLVILFIIMVCCGCCYKNELFGNDHKAIKSKSLKTIRLGDMGKLWKKKRELDGVVLTDKQAEDEWMQRVKDYKTMRQLKAK